MRWARDQRDRAEEKPTRFRRVWGRFRARTPPLPPFRCPGAHSRLAHGTCSQERTTAGALPLAPAMQRGSTPRWFSRGLNSLGPLCARLPASGTLALSYPFPPTYVRRVHVIADQVCGLALKPARPCSRTRARSASTHQSSHIPPVERGVWTARLAVIARKRRSAPVWGSGSRRARTVRRVIFDP